MLSKAEVLYLQGQKPVSKSYERKLKCVIRKKVEGLRKDLPLLSKLIPINQIFDFDNAKLSTSQDKVNEAHDIVNHSIQATKISNLIEPTIRATDISSGANPANIPTNPHILENPTSFDNDKLYNCRGNIHQTTNRRVRSVVRISRRSSEPQVMGSKPTGPV